MSADEAAQAHENREAADGIRGTAHGTAPVPLSVLDLVTVGAGRTATDALRTSVELSRRTEARGFHRYWVAEHHSMPGVASSSPAVILAHLAAHTERIRLGSGGVMLPNHAPLVIAEQFGTLEALAPRRIDLGLGRAPGTDQLTLRALRRSPMSSDSFPQDVLELQALFAPAGPNQAIRAVPGEGLEVPLWILGSSLFGSQLAAVLGLPYAFASHFSPDALMDALAVYRERFQPSAQLDKPHAMVGCNVVIAETDAEAQYLFTSVQQRFADMLRGKRGLLAKPIDDIESYWSGPEKAQAQRMLACSFVGSRTTVQAQLQAFVEKTRADELIVASAIFDHAARTRSYEMLAEIQPALGPAMAQA